MRQFLLFLFVWFSSAHIGFAVTHELLVSSNGTNEVLRYDADNGSFLGVFASGQGLSGPVGLAFDPNGNLLVADEPTGRVLRFNGVSGAFIDTFVSAGSGGLGTAHDLEYGPDGNLYVSSQGTHNVLKYDGITGAFIDTFVPAFAAGINQVLGIAFGPDGNLYVANAFDDRIAKYDGATGAYISDVVAGGFLDYPEDIIFNSDGHLLVSSRDTNEILKYQTDGTFLGVFATDASMSGPVGMAITPDNSLIVSSIFNDEILEFDASSGAFGSVLADSGSGLGLPSMLLVRTIPEPTALTLGSLTILAIVCVGRRRPSL